MRHGKRRTRFGRQSAHRIATLKSLAKAVFLHQRIKTTRTKAKEASRLIESLITLAKKNSLAARRKAFSVLGDNALVRKLFREIAPLFSGRKSGYTRIIPFNFRKGDGASVVFLELTEKKPEEKKKPDKKTAKGVKKPEKAEKAAPAKPERPTAVPEAASRVKEEKAEKEVKKERVKREDRKIEKQKGFLKKVRGFFRRKTNM